MSFWFLSSESKPFTEQIFCPFFHVCSHSSSAEGEEITPNSGIKNKHPAEEEEDYETGEHEVKRLKFDEKEEDERESEENESSCRKAPESSPETPQSSEDSGGQRYTSGASCDTRPAAEDHGKSELVLT